MRGDLDFQLSYFVPIRERRDDEFLASPKLTYTEFFFVVANHVSRSCFFDACAIDLDKDFPAFGGNDQLPRFNSFVALVLDFAFKSQSYLTG